MNAKIQKIITKNYGNWDIPKQRNSNNVVWNKLRYLKKCKYCRCESSQLQIMQSNLSKKYGSSEKYFHVAEIERMVLKKSKNRIKIFINDLKYNDANESMNKFNKLKQAMQELKILIDYYKYYGQKPILFSKDYFNVLYQHQEKMKIVEYNRLKVLLSLDPTEQGNIDECKYKSKNQICNVQVFNILDQINKSQESNEESMLIIKLRDKLSKYIGSSKLSSLKQIDQHFLKPKMKDKLIGTINQKKHHSCSNLKQLTKQIQKSKTRKYRKNCSQQIRKQESESKGKQKSKLKKKRKETIKKQMKNTIAQMKEKIYKQKLKLVKMLGKSYECSNEKTYSKRK